jgi:hypothetical protein
VKLAAGPGRIEKPRQPSAELDEGGCNADRDADGRAVQRTRTGSLATRAMDLERRIERGVSGRRMVAIRTFGNA